ncbi:MAG: hypothetical protein KBD52_00470 [Candidatus Pacebacteria bacterium]|nr:hypothetical protein [Candidatus Paceibacterota bacterium]
MVKFTPTMIVLPIVVLLIVVFVIAEGSIPGSVLYGLKTKIAEPVAGIFSINKEEQVEWDERLIERRLKETEKLITKNKLTETNRNKINENLKNRIESFIFNVQNLVSEKKEITEIADLKLRLEAVLSAYQNILSGLSLNTNVDENTKKEVSILVSTLKVYEVNIKNNRENTENELVVNEDGTIANTNIPLSSASVHEKQLEAEETLNGAKLLYQKNKVKFPVGVQVEIDTRFAEAEKLLEEANVFDTASDYINSINTYQKSINLTNEAKLLILTNLIRENIKYKNDEWDENEEDED